MTNWRDSVGADPLPWLLEPADPGPRHLALRLLAGLAPDDPELVRAGAAAMAADPIAPILAAQSPEGWWVRPGHGYGPKYSGTVWNVMFLDQMGADGGYPAVRRACEYVLEWVQTTNGGFGASGPVTGRAAPSGVVHCLNGNLLRAMIGFGLLDDPRVRRSIEWQAAAITGAGLDRTYASGTSGPGFRCASNGGHPCAWGAVKALLALARVPRAARTAPMQAAIDVAVEFLLSRDPSVADYPTDGRTSGPSGSWFKLAFPLGYVTDVLQNMEALCDAGHAADPRLDPAFEWLLSKRDARGRWRNGYSYHAKMVRDIDKQGDPSKWVTLRACRVLKARADALAQAPARAAAR